MLRAFGRALRSVKACVSVVIAIAIVSVVVRVLRPSVNQYDVSASKSRFRFRSRAFLKFQHGGCHIGLLDLHSEDW